jgi:hypothetical protein
LKEVDILERADDGQRGKEAADGFTVDVGEILRVGRYDDRGQRGGKDGNAQNGVAADKGEKGLQRMVREMGQVIGRVTPLRMSCLHENSPFMNQKIQYE